MRILIVGGCGYIGTALLAYLRETYDRVASADLEWYGNAGNVANRRIDCRCLDRQDLRRFDILILLAGHSSVAMCENNRLASFQNNVENFVHLLSKLDRQRLIYASSSSVYGNTGKIIADEEYATYHATTYYDLAKKEIDLYASLSGLDYYALRFGTVCGYSPNLRLDVMINKMYDTAMRTGRIEIYNSHVYRPILGMGDLCRAVQRICEGEPRPGIYNLASFNATVRDIARRVAAALGGVPVVDRGTVPTYDFSVNTLKFRHFYRFEYQDTVETIVQSLKESYDCATKSVRTRRPYIPDDRPLPLLPVDKPGPLPVLGGPAACQ